MSWHCSQGAPFEKTNEESLRSRKTDELDADPDDAIRFRSCISHLTRDRHIDGRTEIKAHGNETT
jgi:hypothetical protein